MMTATVAGPIEHARPRDGASAPGTAIEIVRNLDEAATLWRGFEAEAIMTPYGRYDWVAAYQRNMPEDTRDTRVALLRGAGGEVLLLMPFQIERRLGLWVAAAVGGKHANYNLPLMRPDFAAALTPERARRFLAEAGRAMGVDAVSVPNAPVAWEGQVNPFAAGGRPGASNAFALRLEASGDATLARSMSSEARRKIRKKSQGLAKVGTVRAARAATPAEAELFLSAFYRQKAQRFGEQGIADPFTEDAVQGFLREAAIAGLAEGRPAVEMHALMVGDDVVAVVGGAADGRRFSAMLVSFQLGPLEKFSLGEMLVTAVIRDLCARSYEVFDLGVGDARYKRSICDEVEALVDVTVPLSLRGRGAALAEAGLLRAKRRIKADPRAMALVARARKVAARLRG